MLDLGLKCEESWVNVYRMNSEQHVCSSDLSHVAALMLTSRFQ